MQETARYTAHIPDKNGYITYSNEENDVITVKSGYLTILILNNEFKSVLENNP